MAPVADHEQLAQVIDDLRDTIRELQQENVDLRKAADDFGALAERLNARLLDQQRAFSEDSLGIISVRVALKRFAGRIARARFSERATHPTPPDGLTRRAAE
jgi:hypothetical protein